MKVSLVIPCYIRGKTDNEMLLRLLDSARTQTRRIDQVIVVDDGSPYTPRGDFECIDYARIRENSGPATARNRGIELALEKGSTYILFSDHDCILSKNWSLEMTAFLRKHALEAAGGLTLAAGDTMIDRFHNINGTLNGRLILPLNEHMLYAPTCNFAISRKVGEEFRFSEHYRKAAGEDVDYCLRVGKKYSIGFCREAIIWHDFGYRGFFSGIPKLVGMFKKYKEANALLYISHPEFFSRSWFDSEPIRGVLNVPY